MVVECSATNTGRENPRREAIRIGWRENEAGGKREECRIGKRAQAANLKQKRGLASPIVTAPSRFPFEIKPSVRPGIEKKQTAEMLIISCKKSYVT